MQVAVIEDQDVREAAELPPPPLSPDAHDPAGGALPLGRLAGLLGSGVFAVGASLTCFAC